MLPGYPCPLGHTMERIEFAIIGAGVGGLAAAAELKCLGVESFKIFERGPEVPLNLHNGVHYLHTPNLNTPFKFEVNEIKATEEIWNPRKDEFKTAANLPEMIDYSMKVMGIRHPSSIMDPGGRSWPTYLPMDNDMNSLLRAYVEYIGLDHFQFNKDLRSITKILDFPWTEDMEFGKILTTVPLPDTLRQVGRLSSLEFKYRPIYVTNYRAKDIAANWLIGIYIADEQFPVYRITILNGIISCESLAPLSVEDAYIVRYHLKRYFAYDMENAEASTWPTGRIWGITKDERLEVLKDLAIDNVYPFGRFGVWNGKLTMDTTIKQAQMLVRHLVTGGDGTLEEIAE